MITYPPEMLPMADDEAEIIVCNRGDRCPLEAEIGRLRAALSWIEDHDPQIVDAAREKLGIGAGKDKPKPYWKGCNARDVPGATCQSPDCDCSR
jgi:hypothetical protein